MSFTTLTDAGYSWWVGPLGVNIGNVTFIGSVTPDGVNRVDRFDWRIGSRAFVELEGPHSADEHNATALAISATQANLIAFYPRHGEDTFIRYQFVDRTTMEAGPQLTLTFSNGISYAQVLQVPGTDTLHVFCRLSSTAWAYKTSTDWGQTWGSEKVLIDSSELTGVLYTMLKPDPDTTSIAHMVAYIRANSGTFHNLGYAQIDLATGAITTAAGGSIGDLDEAAGPDLDLDNELTQAVTTSDNTRPLDIGVIDGRPAIGYALWVGATGPPTYRVARYNGATWDDVAVVASGEPFGHDPDARYVGGMAFGRDGEDGVLRTSRQTSDGEWVLERWLWNGTNFTLMEELARSTDRLIRPWTIQEAGAGIWMHELYTVYNGYTSFEGDIFLYGELVTGVTASGALLRTLSGSHRAMFEARLLLTFQSGDEPIGDQLEIVDGHVEMDAEAEIQRTLQLTVSGRDPDSWQSVWPRHSTDPMVPYGDEIFVRRGVDLGNETLWFPLGFFRIQTLEQDDAPYGPIRIIGLDRMAGIIDSDPLEPREFAATRTVASVFSELVGEIYPDAVIVFDDDSGAATLGRKVVMEDSRYEPLVELATGLGKIMFWDGFGFLQVTTAPDESVPLWEVRAGFQGVLIKASRRITRENVYNGFVFTGEGAGNDTHPARGVAVDAGPTSPTRWGGRFGKVPGFFSSPTITTDGQAQEAAREKLRLSIGAPYGVDFGAVVNPSLRPYDPVRVTQLDGNREIHVMQRIRIPLSAEDAMSGSTKEKTLVVISSNPEDVR